MTTLANVRVNFLADTSQAERAMGRFSQATHAAASAAVGLAGSVALGAVVNKAVAAGSAIHDMSQRSGLSAEFLSSMKMAAEQAGSSLSSVVAAFRRLNKAAEQAGTSKTIAGYFAELKINAAEFVKLAPDEKMRAIAEALSKVEDAGRRGFLIEKLMGGAGLQLQEIFKGGAAAMDDIRASAEKANQVISGDQAAAADELGDKLDTLKASWEGFQTQLGLRLAPTLIAELNQVMKLIDHLAGAINGIFTVLNTAGNVIGNMVATVPAFLNGGMAGAMAVMGKGYGTGDEIMRDLLRDPTKDTERAAAALEEQRKTNELLTANNRLTGEMAGTFRFGVPAVAQ